MCCKVNANNENTADINIGNINRSTKTDMQEPRDTCIIPVFTTAQRRGQYVCKVYELALLCYMKGRRASLKEFWKVTYFWEL